MPLVLIEPNERLRRDARPPWRRGPDSGEASRRRAVKLLCELAVLASASALAVPTVDLCAKRRCSQDVAFARQTAMYLAHVAFSLSYSEVGRGFRRDRTTAAHACRLVEDRRDDPAIDALIGALESACVSLRRRLVAGDFGAAEVRS